MLLLAIETSCDETAVSFVEARGEFPDAEYEVLGNALWSQIDIHREYGGVFPAVAKREHAATLVPMLEKALTESELPKTDYSPALDPDTELQIRQLLEREPGLADQLLTFHREQGRIAIARIAVTNGPGLEPALWVGINFARALGILWDVPVVPVDHMEGHILASVYDVDRDLQLSAISFPAIALLISGGHTELIKLSDWKQYERIGQTRDDAVGEAYDKVARLLDLPYPGGPEIAKLAERARREKLPPYAELPSPMLHSGDLDFSFSGLKTAVRYAVADNTLSEQARAALARDFEDAVCTVLSKKVTDAIEQHGAQTLIVGGGVSANTHIRHYLDATLLTQHPEVTIYFPQPGLSTDNSVMIALAGHAHADQAIAPHATNIIRAEGARSLA